MKKIASVAWIVVLSSATAGPPSLFTPSLVELPAPLLRASLAV